ncbi:endo-1,4-beta-xylanase [Anaerophaga thermohalophila]|uniref:endo-1,4-beta-xylanase n=1 Tax=Anaerophaga thermohalophila TaxID=177400 RepID=UPI0002D4B466|nr:endo-1,4-beta-xylanase [Anaerophaga thermohalophila]
MKYIKLISIFVILSFIGISCEDTKMEWEERDPSSEVTVAEIPLKMEEKIERYDALKTYTNMKLGVGVGASLYMDDQRVDSIVNENFDEVVAGYIMKHGPMVQSDGSLDFTAADAFVQKAKDAGLDVFGHTLVWHQNQNAGYLNGLIAPEVIPGPAGANLLSNGDFEENIDGWNSWGAAKEVVEHTTDDAVSGSGSLKAVTAAGAANLWDLEIQSEDVPVIEGHRYEITFFIRSEGIGHVRLAFNNMNLEYPWIAGAETVETSSSWQQVTYNAETLGEDLMPAEGATTMNFRFDIGKDPNMTYYIDNVVMVDIDAGPAEVNYVLNGNFESGDLTNWSVMNAGAGIEVTDTEAFEGSYSAKMTAGESSSNPWDLQLQSADISVAEGNDYVLTFYVKADQVGEGRVSFPGLSNEWPHKDWYDSGGEWTESFVVTTNWQLITARMDVLEYAEGNTSFKLSFDFGYVPNVTYYIDNVKFVEATGPSGAPLLKSSGPTIIEKTDEEKTQIITDALENWISEMVGHYKNDITAWDVVNEPMNNDGTVRDGNVTNPANDEFYWQKYLGGDYAVMAFNLARQYGNQNDILFINDYGLESSIPKCQGLIDYVEYIEAQGAQVDGIGTQMHISINTNKENIVQMFELLAATGKLIKVSELDVQVLTDAPTSEDFEKQAEMYQFVVENYREIIPEAQQYGITVWGLSDAEQEHENWLPDDAPCLWDADYKRKLSYKAFADGLAGRDVSEDFTGELQY